MRTLALSLLLVSSFVTIADAEEPALPNAIIYLLGGVVSGPYRLTVDLQNDRLMEAKPPPGVRGDGARVFAADIPETARRALTPGERDTFRALGATVWRDGVARRGCLQGTVGNFVCVRS